MENLKLFEIFAKLPVFIFLGLLIFSSIILFSSEFFIKEIGLDTFKLEYKSYIGIVFLLSFSILISKIIILMVHNIKNKSLFKSNRKIQLEYLNNLTYEELTYLKPYIIENINTQYFVISDGIAGGLYKKGILYRSSDHGDMLHGFPYNIQPWAKEALQNKKIDFSSIRRRNKTPYEEYLSY